MGAAAAPTVIGSPNPWCFQAPAPFGVARSVRGAGAKGKGWGYAALLLRCTKPVKALACFLVSASADALLN